jgi:hypothetical protein
MTLPQLLSQALKAVTGNDAARYVFHLGKWHIEQAQSGEYLILTLTTIDGFQVAFATAYDTAVSLGRVLQQEPEEKSDEHNPKRDTNRTELN